MTNKELFDIYKYKEFTFPDRKGKYILVDCNSEHFIFFHQHEKKNVYSEKYLSTSIVSQILARCRKNFFLKLIRSQKIEYLIHENNK